MGQQLSNFFLFDELFYGNDARVVCGRHVARDRGGVEDLVEGIAGGGGALTVSGPSSTRGEVDRAESS